MDIFNILQEMSEKDLESLVETPVIEEIETGMWLTLYSFDMGDFVEWYPERYPTKNSSAD